MSTMSVHHVHHKELQSYIYSSPSFLLFCSKRKSSFHLFSFLLRKKAFYFSTSDIFRLALLRAVSREGYFSNFFLCFSFFLLFCIYSGICWGQRGMMVWKNTFSLQNTYFFLQKYIFFHPGYIFFPSSYTFFPPKIHIFPGSEKGCACQGLM